VTRNKKNQDCGEVSFYVIIFFIVLSLNIMTRFLEIKKFSKLDENILKRKRTPTKQNQDKEKKTPNLSSLRLFTFVVLLSIDASVAIVTILLLCFKK
jgi:hypothetical protein